ncbi:MAG: PEP-CTERM sorting domain-containing protein [Fimbriimonadaceae bacterium]|nr:PEP-CTERM sorting domain-containing protein [Fimbriimonadaceae bacterium]
MSKSFTRFAVVALAATFAGSVFAEELRFEFSGNGTGDVGALSTFFAPGSETLGLTATLKNTSDAFWVAFSPGPNPKGHAGELALYYFDARNASNPIVTAYAYNGANGFTSAVDGSPASGTQAPDKIASSLVTPNFLNSASVVNNGNGTRTFSMNLDATLINDHTPLYPGSSPWLGSQWGDKLGIWFHAADITKGVYGADGFFKSDFSALDRGWLDTANMPATPVPEPASMALLGGAAAALIARRRRKA